ncbi:MAG: CoA pyrophosphatase [Deltaproteobacteria bacterium HGW-Deltaproteobacteria-14]|jgi:8-oxo-dGTP pyrophosphatase MutT (NUDIX family)|nr:MAG: CoA pyrophosphatase [Deltaproteobacteria bacterium HGW-Deltaproteobacteria-14]
MELPRPSCRSSQKRGRHPRIGRAPRGRGAVHPIEGIGRRSVYNRRVSLPLPASPSVATAATLARALARYRPRALWGEQRMVQAAVAIVARDDANEPGGTELLFIERVKRAGDPWSGNMAFPGGRAHPEDRDVTATAVRETREEVGLDLETAAERVGRLSTVLAMAHDGRRPMAVHPIVFRLDLAQELALAPREVAHALWIPLAAFRGHAHRARHRHRILGVPWGFPAWRWEGKLIWGLTHRMVTELLKISDTT